MAEVKLLNISKEFNNHTVVHPIDLVIKDGEFLVLVGPSGCGKTTTLRMIAGLEEPSTGQIFIANKDVTSYEPKYRDIAMVFQNYALYPHMNVYNNMAYSLKLKNTPKDEITHRIEKVSTMLGLENLLTRYPRQLSGGQQQRVALGRAIIRNPKVFLMDEPLSNLDAKLRVQTRAELIKLHQQLKNTVVYVTHDQIEAMTMGTRIVVMKDGLIMQVGTPIEIYHTPQNTFVAGFVGAPPMQFLKGIYTNNTFIGHNFEFHLSSPETFTQLVDKELILGLRPEGIIIDNNAATHTYIPATVEVIENIGSEIIVHTKTMGNENLTIRLLTSELDILPGTIVKLKPTRGNIHIFDAPTGVILKTINLNIL